MLSLSLDANSIDALKAVAFAAVFLFNRNQQVAIALVAHAICEFSMSSPISGFMTALCMSALYAEVAASKITIKSEIRYLFIMISCVNLLCAADIFVSPKIDTNFSIAYPYLINLLDLFIIYHLFRPDHGGGKIAKVHNFRHLDRIFNPDSMPLFWPDYRPAGLSRGFTFWSFGATLCKSKESKPIKANRT